MENIDNLLKILRKGEAVILPSDTVYGLFADALNVDSIKKIDNIKGSNKPHLMLISNVNMLYRYVKNVSPLHKKIIDKYWPGELTILFEKNDLVPDELTKGSSLVGIRYPNNKFLIELINEYDRPLLSTSANITNESVITSISELDDRIRENVSYIYDIGKLTSVASTLIKIENNKIIILREGKLANKIKADFNEYL